MRDAERAIHLRPEWAKGYYREGEALAKLGRHEEVRTLFSSNGTTRIMFSKGIVSKSKYRYRPEYRKNSW